MAKKFCGSTLITVLVITLSFLCMESTLAAQLATTLDYPVEPSLYKPGSFHDRVFFKNNNHLGEDIDLPEGTAIKAIGNGVIILYRGQYSSGGYGELYAIIEHNLSREMEFVNAYGQIVKTSKIYSIYGHIRKSQERGGKELTWKVGDEVKIGDVIGYVNDDAHNGDGDVHLHLGLRLRVSDGDVNLGRGYEGDTDFGKDFAAASAVIAKLCYAVIKPSDSNKVYLISNNQLWHIKDEETYALLGFHLPEQCNTPDWSHIQEM